MSQAGRPPSAIDALRSSPDNSTVKAISDFQAIASKVDDASSIYRVLRPFWASSSVAHLVEPAEKVLSLVPSSRSAVLNYLGMLVHEATHLYFSKKENPYFGTDNSNVERAVRKLARDLEQLISSTDQRSFSLQVLAYLCSLFIELCTCNYERPIAKQAGIGPRTLLLLFQSSPSISSLLRLFERAAANLLECAPDDCFNTLLDASRHGFYFDWMWLHVAASFPAPVISFLLKTGAEEFKQYALTIASHEQQGNQAAAFETHQVYNQKFMPLAETFMYLASKRNAELSSVTREMLIKGIAQLNDANEATLVSATDLSLPFLFKIVTSSPDVLRFLAQHANELVKSSVVLKACMQMSQISKHCILPMIPGVNHTYMAFLERFLCFLSVDAIASLLDTTLPIAFDEHVFDQVSLHNKQFCDGMKDGAIELVNAIISTIIASVHRQALFSKAENGTLGRCIIDARKLNEYILGAMSGGERGKFNIRLLYAFCILAGPMKTSEVIVRFILDAEDKPQLNALCALLVALAPIMPTAAEDAIKDFVSLKDIIERERKKKSAGSRLSEGLMSEADGAHNAANVMWIRNLHSLNVWQNSAPEDHPLKYIRFEMTRQYGQLMAYLLTWTRDELDRIECDTTIKSASEKEELRANLMLAMIGFSTSIGPPAVLKPRYAHKLCAQFASLLITLLKSTGDAEQPSAFSLFLNACGPVVQFLESQPVYVRGQFATHFLDEALSRTKELFGGSYEKQIRFDGGYMEPATLQNALKEVSIKDNYGESLFDRARRIPIEQRKPFDMANCGIIGKGVRRLQKVTIQEGECFHQMLFIECATRFAGSTNTDDKFFPIPSVYRQLAETITQRVCKDGLVSTFTWNEWEVEREAAHKYIAVAKTVSDIPFVWSLLSVISEVHPCLWYCIPVLKAILASVMIHFENNSDQKSHPSENLLDTLDRWFLISRKGKVLPIQMVVFFDIISKVTYREGFVILLDIWRYFQSIVHPLMINTFNEAIERSSDVVLVDPIKGDVSRFTDSCRLVIQRNIARLGALFPLLLIEESPEAVG